MGIGIDRRGAEAKPASGRLRGGAEIPRFTARNNVRLEMPKRAAAGPELKNMSSIPQRRPSPCLTQDATFAAFMTSAATSRTAGLFTTPSVPRLPRLHYPPIGMRALPLGPVSSPLSPFAAPVHEVVAEPALDAEEAVGDRMVARRGDLDDTILLDMEA